MARRLMLLCVAVLSVAVAGDNDAAADQPPKHPRCHKPLSWNCRTSTHKSPTNAIVAWYYFAVFKSCHPLYATGGVHHCDENRNLPGTREECEELCGESCRMDNGTEGICTFEEFCRKPPHSNTKNMTPCKAYGVNCCHRTARPANKLLYSSTAASSSSHESVNNVDYDSSDDQNKTNGQDIHAAVRPKPLGL